MLQTSARDFLQSQRPVAQLRKLRDDGSGSGFSQDTWAAMCSMGWPAIAVPEKFGGHGFGYAGLGIVLQETGRSLTSSPLLASAMMATAAILQAGGDEQQASLLPGIASGACIATLAFEEGRQHKPHRVECRADRNADGYVLEGQKRFVLEGHVADVLIVSARTRGSADDADGISLFRVPRDAAGVETAACQLLDTHVAGELRLERVQLPPDALLGEEHKALPALEYALDCGRIGQSAELLGVAREAFERAVAYLKERRQFGVPVGSFQALQHRCAALFGELELCESLVLSALQALDGASRKLAEIASMTKAKLADIAMKATAEAIQLHGGIGMTDEFDIGFFYKRAQILESLLGDRYYHLDRYALQRGY